MRAVANETGIALAIEVDGSFEVTSRTPAWQFGGNVGSPVSNLVSRRGRDLAVAIKKSNSSISHTTRP
jgi:hypothetical protein